VEEYPTLEKYNNISTWWGHFEFQGFVVTGSDVRMQSGPDCRDYNGPSHIFSGHFHKRQAYGNVIYIGNTFPTNFGDASDNERGCMVFDHTTKEVDFYNWEDCPKYSKFLLSNLIDEKVVIFPDSRVKCIADVSISYEEMNGLRQSFIDRYKLREFIMEESSELGAALTDTEFSGDQSTHIGVDELVVQMFRDIDVEKIDNDMLISIYNNIRVDK
jgi:DNA repair exonuclease SbcCD nuclease subunit